MKHLTLFVVAASVSFVAGCSLSKSNMQTNSASAAPSIAGTSPSSTPVTAANERDNHSNETASGATEINDELRTPAKGSDERQAIMDALRGNQQVVFQVNYLKVHNGWCWVDTTPLDKGGRATAEGGPNLLHLENGSWKVKDLSKVPDDPNDPLGPEDASPTFVKNVMKTFPGVPRDIFPKPSK
jgi:hypothetical protein